MDLPSLTIHTQCQQASQLSIEGTAGSTAAFVKSVAHMPVQGNAVLVNNSLGMCFKLDPSVWQYHSVVDLFSKSKLFQTPPDRKVAITISPLNLYDLRDKDLPVIRRRDISDKLPVPVIEEYAGEQDCLKVGRLALTSGYEEYSWERSITLHCFLMLQDLALFMGSDGFTTDVEGLRDIFDEAPP